MMEEHEEQTELPEPLASLVKAFKSPGWRLGAAEEWIAECESRIASVNNLAFGIDMTTDDDAPWLGSLDRGVVSVLRQVVEMYNECLRRLQDHYVELESDEAKSQQED